MLTHDVTSLICAGCWPWLQAGCLTRASTSVGNKPVLIKKTRLVLNALCKKYDIKGLSGILFLIYLYILLTKPFGPVRTVEWPVVI